MKQSYNARGVFNDQSDRVRDTRELSESGSETQLKSVSWPQLRRSLSRPEKKVVVQGPLELQAYLDSPGDENLKTQIRAMFQTLRANPAAGEHVRKSLWPEKYAKQRINSLFVYRIGDQTRFPYTIIEQDATTRVVRILDFFRTHKEYDRVFRYHRLA